MKFTKALVVSLGIYPAGLIGAIGAVGAFVPPGGGAPRSLQIHPRSHCDICKVLSSNFDDIASVESPPNSVLKKKSLMLLDDDEIQTTYTHESLKTKETKDKHQGRKKLEAKVSHLSFEKLKTALEKKSRPNRYTISTHSALSTIVTAFFFAAVLPHISPGVHENGLPRIFDMAGFDNSFLAKTTAFMFALSAITGVLRLPPRTTKLRRLMFESCGWATVLCYTLQDSNIIMLDGGYSFDLFAGPGWFVIFFVFIGSIISTLEYLVESIAGPDDGRDYLPFGGNRAGMAFVASIAYLGISPMSLTIPPWFFDHNRQAFDSIVAPGLHMYNGWNLSVNFVVEAYMGFGMLVSTLLYEKKVTQRQASVLILIDFFLTGVYDQFATLVPNPAAIQQQEMIDISFYAQSITHSIPLNEIFGSLWWISLTKAMWELNVLRRKERRVEAATVKVVVEDGPPSTTCE